MNFSAALVAFALAGNQAVAFEAAVVKRSDPSSPTVRVGTSRAGGRFDANKATLVMLVQFAYDLSPNHVLGGSGWMSSETFDIRATAARRATDREMKLMLRNLLAERFSLRVRQESREMAVYALVAARPDRGAALAAANGDCQTTKSCGTNLVSNGPLRRLTARNTRMDSLVTLLRWNVSDRFVVNRTGLTGSYDFDLTWSADAHAAIDGGPPSLMTALQEQLGLKLEPSRAPLDVVVIESAARPVVE